MNRGMIYLIVINALALFLMYLDKALARGRMWRIPEAVLFAAAIPGGSLGGTLGMYLFRHKTRKPLFAVGFPILLLIHGLIYLL